MKHILGAVLLSLVLPLPASRGEEDPRFVSGNLGVENSYLEEISEAVLQAFDRRGWSLRGLEGVHKVGGVYVVAGFVALDEVKEPVTEQDFERINGYFEPFIQAQMDFYRNRGSAIASRQNDFPLPAHAKGYKRNELPRMSYILSGESGDLFYLSITFSEKMDDHLVVAFTIVAVP